MISETFNSQMGRDDFMQLMLAQVQHQDPLEPLPQHEFLAQLAQFSTLEGVEQLNSSFENMLKLQEDVARLEQLFQGSNLIGQGVTFVVEPVAQESETSGSGAEIVHGTVDAVAVADGKLHLTVGEDTVSIDQVLTLGAAPSAS